MTPTCRVFAILVWNDNGYVRGYTSMSYALSVQIDGTQTSNMAMLTTQHATMPNTEDQQHAFVRAVLTELDLEDEANTHRVNENCHYDAACERRKPY